MANVTKAKIIRDLKRERDNQLNILRKKHQEQMKEFKLELIREHKDQIESLVNKISPILDEVNQLINCLREDDNIRMAIPSRYHFLYSLESVEKAENFIQLNSTFSKGKSVKFSYQQTKEYVAMEEEWNKLINYIYSLSLAEIKKYLKEHNMTLPCMQEPKEETALVVQDINFNKLWSVKND